MKMKKNKKGFTLVELLAVIVVLAVIMVIAVPSILTQMNGAKQKSFQMWGQRMLKEAMLVYESQHLLGQLDKNTKYGNSGQFCYSYEDLGLNNAGSFKGFVVVTPTTDVGTSGTVGVQYQVYLYDENYAYNGAYYNDVFNNLDAIQTTATEKSAVQAIVDGQQGKCFKNSAS